MRINDLFVVKTHHKIMELVIDVREDKVLRLKELFNETIGLRVEQIETGDFCFVVNGEIHTVFERKTLKDYAASIKDGRLANQREKMLEIRERTNCNVIIILEGPLNPSPETQYGGIKFKNIESSCLHLMVRDKFHIHRTRNVQETIGFLSRFCVSCLNLHQQRGSPNSHLLKERKPPTVVECVLEMWCCLPRVGRVRGAELMSTSTIHEFLSTVETPNETISRMISQVPGFSKKTATLLLREVKNITRLENTPEIVGGLSKLKIGSRALGIKKAERLMVHLHFKTT